MNAQTAERIQHYLLQHDPFATEAYTNLRRGEIIGKRFAALSERFYAHFATFRGPYYPASESKLHVILPNKDDDTHKSDVTTVYGFFEGTAQCFAITIPNTQMPAFLKAARTSWENHNDPEVRSYGYLSDTYQVEGVEPKVFMDALGRKVAHQPMVQGEMTHNLYQTIQLYKLNSPSGRIPFFGREENTY